MDRHIVPGITLADTELSNGSRTSFYDPAYRATMVARLQDAALIPSKYGKDNGENLFSIHNRIIGSAIRHHNGREVHYAGDDFLISFASVIEAVNCGAEIQKQFEVLNCPENDKKSVLAIGISCGDPVTVKNDLFGEAVQLARRLCYLSACKGEIMISSEITEQLGAARLRMLSGLNRIDHLGAAEEKFFNRFMDVVEKFWQRQDIKLEDICRQVGTSRSQLYRNITSLSGKSFVSFMKEYRLKKALKLIEKNHKSITQIAFETGFNNPSYFTKCFKENFGILPSELGKTF